MSDVYLYVYDLTKGMARQFSAMFLGKHFDGVWHTGIVAYEQEWYFGSDGIASCPPKGTILGEPNEKILLGHTELNESEFLEVISQMSENDFKIGTYNLLEHNCNNFSNELAIVLVGKPIPKHIIDLPKEILNTPLGPMLRPLLEQAADPMSKPEVTKKYNATTVNSNIVSSHSKPDESNVNSLPITVILYKPDLQEKLNTLIEFGQKVLKLNDYNLLVEIKEYLQQTEVKWSITAKHVNILFDLYLIHAKNEKEHSITALKLFQMISLRQDVAIHIANNERLVTEFLVRIKETNSSEVKSHSLQVLSNICSHCSVSHSLLQKHQEVIFKELSEYTLIENDDNNNQDDVLIHESSISFFFNLTSAYHLEKYLNDANALTLGVALLERLPKLKSKPKTIYQMLSLLRSCLTKSQDMRELALSMNFDMSKYQQNINESAFANSTSDTSSAESSKAGKSSADEKHFEQNEKYETIVKSIDHLIHPDLD